MKVIGRNAVTEALKSGSTIDRLIAARDLKDAGAQRIINDAKSRGIKIFFYDKEVLDREAAGKKHQGFIAEITDFKYCETEDILALAEKRGESPFILILDGVEDPHNLGSILRVAECGGVHGVIIPRHRSVSVNDTVVKVSAAKIKELSENDIKSYPAKLEQRIKQLLSDFDVETTEQRILTEAAIFADKAAIDEELVRLDSHFKALDEIVHSDETAGRKLDFLVQEINREINTIGSKAGNSEIAHLVVEMKTELEKIREQIQNIE